MPRLATFNSQALATMNYVSTEKDQNEKPECGFYLLYHQSMFSDLFILRKTAQSIINNAGIMKNLASLAP